MGTSIDRYTRLLALLGDLRTNLAVDLRDAINAALDDSYERGYTHGFHDETWQPETKYERAVLND